MISGARRVNLIVGASFVAATGAGYWLIDRGFNQGGGDNNDDGRAASARGDAPGGRQLQRVIEQGDPLAPRFFVSHPTLLNEGGRAVRERWLEGPDDHGRANVPYFIQFIDGRYAFGRTNDAGDAQPLYTEGLVAHRVFWGHQALQRAHDAVVTAPPDQSATPLQDVHRWGDLKRAVAVSPPDRRIPLPYGVHLPPGCDGPAASSNGAPLSAGATACSLAVAGDSPVARSCVAGGRGAAKKTMKCLVSSARARGETYTCEQCHRDVEGYALKAGAVDLFNTMLGPGIDPARFAKAR